MGEEILPNAWAICTFEDVTLPVAKNDQKKDADKDIWYVDISSIDNAANCIVTPQHLRLFSAPSRARQIISEGDVLFSLVRPYLRKIAPVPKAYDGEVASTGFAVLRPADGVDPSYMFYKAISRDFVSALTGEQYGVSYPAVKEEQVKAQPLELPPHNEQRRIVAKIEELFSELDKGVESLKTARAQLKTYRQAVLKHAFEGKLTAKWREENKDKLEPADKLLERIPAHRMKKLDDITAAETKKFPEIPSAWKYARLGYFIDRISAGKSFKCDEREPRQDEIGVAKVSAVTWGEYDETESKTCISPEKINPDYYINCGDFLFSRANTIELVGACVIAKQVTKKVMLSDKTLRVQFDDINPYYFLFYLRSQVGRNEIMERSTGNQDSMRNIGQERIRNIIIPICSALEADQIQKEIQRKFFVIGQFENTIDSVLKKSEVLRQSILKKAFSGQLVLQDPSDEPASVLLERIRAEKAAQANAKAKPKAKKKSKRKTAA